MTSPSAGPRRGFDVVLGNPPWDTMSPDLKEFFARFDPQVRFSDKQGQERIVEGLLASPNIAREWDMYQRQLYAAVHFIKNSGRYRLFAEGNLGKGDFNVYRMFVETALDRTTAGGYAAQLVPENLYNGPNAAAIRLELFEHTTLELLLGFENTREIWFKDIDSRTKFCLYVARIGGSTTRFPTAFRVCSLEDLSPSTSNRLQMHVSLVREQSPDAMAIPELSSQAAVNVSVKVYDRWPKFGDDRRWTPTHEYMREVDMGTNRDLFNNAGEGLPVYEGRMVAQFDHRAKGHASGRGRAADWEDQPFDGQRKAIRPQWWVAEHKLPPKLRERVARYRICFCKVGSPTNERSLVSAILPPRTVSGDAVPTILFDDNEHWRLLLWVACANSFVIDYLVRRKVSLNLTHTILDSIPIPNPPREEPNTLRCLQLAAGLTCCGPEMEALWQTLVEERVVSSRAMGGIVGERERLDARAELDALIATHFLALTPEEMSFILEDFPTAAKYELARWSTFLSRQLILERMSAFQIGAGRVL